MNDLDFANSIYGKYSRAYGKNPQGCCILIADEIQRQIGGEVVAGELWWYGGSCRRSHWWVEKNGAVVDPMGDYVLSGESGTDRHEIHRDAAEFAAIIPEYEKWRV